MFCIINYTLKIMWNISVIVIRKHVYVLLGPRSDWLFEKKSVFD